MLGKIKKWKVFAFTILLVMFGAGIVYAATFQQGYGVGCGLGSQETYVGENQGLYLQTLDMALQAGEMDYFNGVESGYAACRYVAPPPPPPPCSGGEHPTPPGGGGPIG